jgi:hypothetical protein
LPVLLLRAKCEVMKKLSWRQHLTCLAD